MRISENQMASLAVAARKTFFRRCLASLRREYPTEADAYTEPALAEHIATYIEHLEALGFSHTDPTERALLLLFSYQHKPNRHPMPDDLIQRLRDPYATEDKKLEALEQLAIFG